MGGRASIFDDSDDDPIDISGFGPKPVTAPSGPPAEKVRTVSEAANFRSREAQPPTKSAPAGREPRRYRTGRNIQFNVKATQETIDRFYTICDKQGWVMGFTLEQAIDALEAALASAKREETPSRTNPR